MTLDELEAAVSNHSGEFLCERINDVENTKVVRFAHVVEAPEGGDFDVPPVGKLDAFCQRFGSILFYHDENSGDAGRYLAHPSQWADLHDGFSAWIDDLDEEDRRECLPTWIDTCLVIGETPRSGNYVLVPTEGTEAGRVVEFDHDGFEFTDEAKDIVEYVKRLLNPDSSMLTGLASYMRFIDGDPMVQWWIRELSDNAGRVVSTRT